MNVIPHWNRLLVVAVVAVLLTASMGTARADLVMSGTTFYSYDFEDLTVAPNTDTGPVPLSSSGEVSWATLQQGSRTRVNLDPDGSGNLTLRSDPRGSSSITGINADFSATMEAAVPTNGTVDFRLYLDDLVSEPSVFRVMQDVDGSINNANTVFGLVANAGGVFTLLGSGQEFETRAVVLDEWIDVTIDYSLDSSTDNLKVTYNSPSISNEMFTFSKDLTGLTIDGFLSYNPGSASGDNVFHLDDINWQVSAVPEPSSFAFFSLVALLATGMHRKKSV